MMEEYRKKENGLLQTIEKQNSLIEKLKLAYENEERTSTSLRNELETTNKKVLNEQELNFYYCCKADLVCQKLVQQNIESISYSELSEKQFPITLLENDNTGVTTSNYKLILSTDGNYKLSMKNDLDTKTINVKTT